MDKGTGREQKITITASSNMSDEDIQKAIKEAELHAAEDKERKEKVETKNQAESTVYQTEKTLGEIGDKVSEEDKAPVNEALARLKDAISRDDTAAMKTETEAVTQAFYKVSEKLYQAAGGAASGAPNPEDFAGYGAAGAGAADAGSSPFTTGGDDNNDGFKNAGGDF